MSKLSPPPLGLYCHLPWCVRKCPYCDFNSHELKNLLPAAQYMDSMIDDLRQDLPLVWGRPVSSIYFGGGTPSLFDARLIEDLLSRIRALLPLAPGAEISLEANPGTVERDSFSAYADAGINRISLGVQSFNDGLLKSIGRIHGRADIERSLRSLHDSAISNFNLDLMYGLPGQSPEQGLEDLHCALDTKPTHISHYQLTIEPNTAFAAKPPELPGEEECWDIAEAATELLEQGDMRQYEVSAWATPGNECRHNLNYWRFGDYLGIGAGAHAKLTLAGEDCIRRLAKTRHPRRYMEGDRVAQDKVVGESERVFEYFLNAMRLRGGFDPGDFPNRTGLNWAVVSEKINKAIRDGLLEERAGLCRPTALGWRFVNDLQAIFLPENA